DLHLIHGKIPGVEPGLLLGHEFLGVVEEVGDAVRLVETGGRYVASMTTACGSCRPCSRHDYPACGSFALFGMGYAFGGLDGGQAEYVRIPLADMTLAEIPEALSDDDALLTTDILPTAYTAMVRAGVRPGDTVAVVGAGPVGLMAIMSAQTFGASKVLAIDLLPQRLKEAEALGAIAINASEVDPADAVAEHTGQLGADVVVEAVGVQSAVETAWAVARSGAVIALVGALIEEDWPTTCGDSWLRRIDVRPILGDPITHRHDLMRLIESGRLDPARIISHRFPLDEGAEAYRLFDAREATKVVLTP
ncbi:MAG: zinc-binding dehydrogenase, partial [Acidimicrobiia bacterium]